MLKKYINIIKYEIILSLKIRISYKSELITNLALAIASFFLAYYLNQGTSMMSYYNVNAKQESVLFLIGFLFWQVCSLALGYSTSMIRDEAMLGTLEVKIQSVFSVPFLLFIRMIISVMSNFICYIVLIVFSVYFMHMEPADSGYIVLSFLIMIPSIIVMYGVGLIFACIALKEKSTGQLIFIVQVLMLIYSNMSSPGAKTWGNVLPYTSGVEIMRNLYLHQGVEMKLVFLYLVINFIWIFAGVFVMRKMVKHERTYGSFNQY